MIAPRPIVEWHIGGGKVLTLDRTYIMGILNVTPDSFSDGGKYAHVDAAVARAYEMAAQGADIIDIGGQSTRPGHTPISPDEEWQRIQPVLSELTGSRDFHAVLSVDSYFPEVAGKAAAMGVQILNDVSGFRNYSMRCVAAQFQTGCVVMHSSQLKEDADVCQALRRFYLVMSNVCVADGIPARNLCFDPGVGFGKSYEQNLQIAASFEQQCMEGYPMLAAASRKRVIGMSCGNPPAEQRVSGTVAYHTACLLGGAHILRVHDVPEAVQAAQVADAIVRSHSLAKIIKNRE